MSDVYRKVLSPIDVAGHTLENRIIMGSMHTGLEEEKSDLSKLAAFFEARAKGGVGLIITGGVAPHWRGWVAPFAGTMTSRRDAKRHRVVTDAVHAYKSKIVMQILHAGRYSYHPFAVAPSAIKAPISPFKPWAPTTRGVKGVVQQFVRCARYAEEAGYDGVEVMGSEGYLINQFIAQRTNRRKDQYGGSYENRMRFALEIVEGIRGTCSPNFMIVFRLSMLDLVEGGSSWGEVVELAKRLESAGVSIFNTGIGWHEARIPTIATSVPRAAYSWVTRKLKKEVQTPLAAVNRINSPEVADEIIANGDADFVTMARPFLADADFVQKAKNNQGHLINTCIACNQACLDHVFEKKRASCLVNPLACHETERAIEPTGSGKNVAVVGGGPAGLSAAMYAAERGFAVTLFEKSGELGGQFNLAKQIPGKEEFHETLRYYREKLNQLNVNIKLNTAFSFSKIESCDFSAVAWATGVIPRVPNIEGVASTNVVTYSDAIRNPEKLGDNVVVIGGGGIAIDTAARLLGRDSFRPSENADDFYRFWGIDSTLESRAGLVTAEEIKPHRKVTVLYRSSGKPGKGLGKTTSWIHRLALKKEGVEFIGGLQYEKITDKGIVVNQDGTSRLIPADHIVICTGQESQRSDWKDQGEVPVTLIGGAKNAGGIDAKRAILEGMNWARGLQ